MNHTHQRTAWVTGGAQGIGKAIAARLLDAGMSVLIADNDHEALAETEAELQERGACVAHNCDVADEDDVRHAVATAAPKTVCSIPLAVLDSRTMSPPSWHGLPRLKPVL